MRLFVAAQPPAAVLAELEALVARLRAAVGGDPGALGRLRWSGRSQWHVTLRFLGDVTSPDEVVAALAGTPLPGALATMGPRVGTLGRAVVCLPVAGLDDLAAAVTVATAHVGRPPEGRPFSGHLTLARARGRRARLPALPEDGLSAQWPVEEVHVVRSRTHPDGSRYEVLATSRCVSDPSAT